MRPVVEGHEYTQFRAGVEQAASQRIFAHHMDDRALRQPGGNRDPSLAVVARLPRVRCDVVEPMPVHGDVSGRRIEVRGLEHADGAPGRHRRRGDVAPHQAIVVG